MDNKSFKLTKIFYLINLIPLLVFDTYSLLSLLSLKVDYMYMLFIAILLVLDILYTLVALSSNTRLKYSIKYSIVYFVLSTIVTLLLIYLYHFRSDSVIMTFDSFIYFALRIGISFIVTIPVNLFLRHSFKHINKPLVVLACIASFALFVFNFTFVSRYGFFGQGKDTRPLIYRIVDDETYEVVDIVGGTSTSAVVTDSFDSRKVNAVSMKVFEDSNLKEVTINSKEGLFELHNLGEYKDFNQDIKINVSKDEIDRYREIVFNQVNSNSIVEEYHSALIDMFNAFVPNDLADGDYYVTYELDDEVNEFFDHELLKVWIGHRDDNFRLPEGENTDGILAHMDSSDEENLKWAYERKGYILKGINNKEGIDILDKPIDKSMDKVKINLEKIYKLTFNPCNDGKYEISHEYTRSMINGSLDDSKYVLDSKLDTLMPERVGFTLSYQVNGESYSTLREVVSSSNDGSFTINPIFEMKAPRIDFYKTNLTNDTLTYGENVTFSWDAYVASDEFSLKAEVFLNDTLVYSDNDITKNIEGLDYKYELTLNNVYPNQAGSYKIVLHNSHVNSTLNSSIDSELTLTVNPITLALTWDNLTSVYDGLVKNIALATFNSSTIINSDVINLQYSADKNDVKDFGTYTLTATVDEETAKKYQLTNTTATYNVTKRDITIDSLTNEYTYDGTSKGIIVTSIGNVVSGEDSKVLSSLSSTTETNAGSYSKTITTTNANYNITNPTHTLTINKRALTITVLATNKVYDGAKADLRYSASGLASSDTEAQVFSVSYQAYDTTINAGTYEITPQITNNAKAGNYEITIIKATLTITPKPLTITLNSLTKEYDGLAPQLTYSYDEKELASGDNISQIGNVQYSDGVESVVYVGTYSINATLSNGVKRGNYEVTIVPGTLTITKKALTIKANDVTKEYDGVVANLTYTANGLASTDSIAQVATVEFDATSTSTINAGSYDITINLTQKDKYNNYEVTIEKGTLQINKKALTVTTVDTSKVFDHKTATLNYNVTGLASTDTESDVFTFSFDNTQFETDAGSYDIGCVLTPKDKYNNYEIEIVKGVLTINKATLTVTAKSLTKTYDGKSVELEYEVSGLVSPDALDSVVTISINGSAVGAVDAGSYEITLSAAMNALAKNYDVELVDGTLTIEKRTVTMVWDEVNSFVHDGSEKSITVKEITGLDDFSASEITEILNSIVYEGNGEKEVGSYTVTAKLSDNFTINNATSTYTIVEGD